MIHKELHPLAGKTVRIKEGATHPQIEGFGGAPFQVEDFWDRVMGRSWKTCDGNFAATLYATRIAANQLPMDDEVVYGKIGPFGHLVHISELGDVIQGEDGGEEDDGGEEE